MAKNIELLSYEHDDFDIHVSTDCLDSPRNKLKRTYVSRSVELPKYDEMLVWVGSQPMLPSFDSEGPPHIQPFFFENRQYRFEIEFNDHVAGLLKFIKTGCTFCLCISYKRSS